MRALKLAGIVLGALVALLIIALLAIRLFVDPNNYKGRIEQAVKGSTGRELTLSGPIKLAVFPWIALELGPASLGNPPGFSTEPFAAVRHVALRVKLLPLLHKELQVGRVEIDGLDLRLHKNAAGRGNWQDFGGKGEAPPSTQEASSGSTTLPELAGVVVRNSRISYQDTSADHLNFELGQVSAVGKQYSVAGVNLSGTLQSGPNATVLPWKFSIPTLKLDLDAQTLNVPAFTAQLASAQLTGDLRGSKIVDAPNLNGAFKLEPVALRELMGKLGMTTPQTRDNRAFSKLAASGAFTYGGNTAAANDLDVQLDDSRLRGKLALTNLDTKATRFNLSIDHINVDRYRAPEAATPQPAAKPAASSSEPPSDVFKTLQTNGTLSIGSVTVSGMNLTQVSVTVVAKDAVTHIAPARAKLYGGDYSGDITVDDREKTPTVQLNQSMTGIDMAQLLKDFAKSQRVSGRGSVTTNLTTHALGGDALMKTLGGHIAANVDNGAVEGIDLWFEINRAVALVQKQSLPAGQSSGRTKFDTFKASADIANGVAATKDLNIASQNLRVTGQGTTNLITQAINYQLKTTILKGTPGTAPAGAGAANTLADIPLNITGTIPKPEVRPDLQAMAKVRLQQEIDKHKGEVQQKLMDKLKGVFK